MNAAVDAKLDDFRRWAIGLPPDQRSALLVGLGGLVVTLAASSAMERNVKPEQDSNKDDRLLTAEEAAAILGVTPRWLYRHAKGLPFAKRISRKCLRFVESGTRKWLATKKA